MKTVIKSLNGTLKQMLDALAYADAGEYLSGLEKSRILAEGPAAAKQSQQVNTKPVTDEENNNTRRVALYLGSELPKEVMDYTVQTCARLRHDLTIVTFESRNTANSLLDPFRKTLEEAGVDMKLAVLAGDPLPRISHYLRSHPEVAFLACKDVGYLGRSYMNGTLQSNKLPVPVVVVASKGEAAAEAGQSADQDINSTNVA
jgi:hypothetical protein